MKMLALGNFQAQRITNSLWPEVTGIGAYALAQIMMANQGINPDYVKYGGLATGAGLIGFNVAPDFGKGVLFASGVEIVVDAVQNLYNRAKGGAQVAQIPAAKRVARIPYRTGSGMPGIPQAAVSDALVVS